MEPSLGYVYPKEEQPPQNENDHHKPNRFLNLLCKISPADGRQLVGPLPTWRTVIFTQLPGQVSRVKYQI